LIAALLTAWGVAAALAGPQGGQLVAGNATIRQSSTTTINQSTAKAAIDWTNFSIGKAEFVRFKQSTSSFITLNRVTGLESSQILGSLSANGQVFILNPSSTLFGKDAQINVDGITASTRNMSNGDFIAGNCMLSVSAAGSVVNEEQISVAAGDVIALVQNTSTLNALRGSVFLAAADAVTLKLQDGSLVGYKDSLLAVGRQRERLVHADGIAMWS
jgi:filamentous hemagglutinin family protein